MYSTAEISVFMAQIFNEIDTSIGSQISIPQGGRSITIITKSVTFWSAWMKFKQKTRNEQHVGLNIELFKIDTTGDQPVKAIASGSYNTAEILVWAKANPRTMFYMSIRYRSQETAKQGIFTFANPYELN